MRAIVGLGNPGRDYAHSRHNLGFRVVEVLAERWRLAWTEHACAARLAWAGSRVALVQPQTWMNASGRAVACLCRRYGLRPADVIVVYDDVDLPLGRVRIRRDGGSAGHRGLGSILAALEDSEIARVKLGVGRPPAGVETADFVLQPFTPAEEASIVPATQRAADVVERILEDGLERAMAVWNGAETGTSLRPEPTGR